MKAWLNAMNPAAAIEGEAQALRAARASAISIIIGVIVGVVSAVWSFTHMDSLVARAMAQAEAGQAAAIQPMVQASLWVGVALTVVQVVFAVVQWRDPKRFIAILFLVLIALGGIMTLAGVVMAGSMNVPPTPIWEIALTVVILIVQAVLHVAGLRGIDRLDAIQMAAAR